MQFLCETTAFESTNFIKRTQESDGNSEQSREQRLFSCLLFEKEKVSTDSAQTKASQHKINA
jgi:hypothetical protein